MRNSVFATALLVLVLGCGSAWAADLDAAAYNWTGFYAGLNAGVAKNDSKYSITNLKEVSATGGFEGAAFTGGGQAGYNYQAGNWVYGLETDFNYDGTDDSSGGPLGFRAPAPPGGPVGLPRPTYTVTQQLDYFGTLRGRLGCTPADRLLFYVTGGLAYGYVSSSTSLRDSTTSSGSSSALQAGWAFGAGGEYGLTKNWSVRLECLHIDLGSMSYSYIGVTGGATTATTTVSTAQNVIRVGVNYKF